MADETETAARKPADVEVTARVEKAGMGLVEKIGIWGLGTVLVLYMLPQVMKRGDQDNEFIQGKLITTLETNIAKQVEATGEMKLLGADVKGLTDQVEELVDEQKNLTERLKPLTSQVERAATAVEEQTKAEAGNDADSSEG